MKQTFIMALLKQDYNHGQRGRICICGSFYTSFTLFLPRRPPPPKKILHSSKMVARNAKPSI